MLTNGNENDKCLHMEVINVSIILSKHVLQSATVHTL